jgi:hypothetical protein
MVVRTGTARLGRRANSRQELVERRQGLVYRIRWQALENRFGEFFFLAFDGGGGASSIGGQCDSLRASVVEIVDTVHETAFFETRDISGQCTGGNTEALRKLAESKVTFGQRIQRCSLSDCHAAAADI